MGWDIIYPNAIQVVKKIEKFSERIYFAEFGIIFYFIQSNKKKSIAIKKKISVYRWF